MIHTLLVIAGVWIVVSILAELAFRASLRGRERLPETEGK